MSFLQPSSADIWVHCGANPLYASMYPEPETEDTKEGEASHWVVATVLTSYITGDGLVLASDLTGEEAPNGVIITQEMIENAQVCIDDVLDVCQEFGLLAELHIEDVLTVHSIHSQLEGRPDIWVFDKNRSVLYVWDYKYGHKSIPADSYQNKCYVKGALEIINLPDDHVKVDMRVIQPRSYNDEGPIKSYTCKASDLRADFNKLEIKAHEACSSSPNTTSGNHCQYCPGRHACKSAGLSAMSALDYTLQAVPQVLSGEGLSFELTILKRGLKAMEHRLKGLETDALSRVTKGELVPGYGTKEGKGIRKFAGKVEDVIEYGDLVGIDLRAPLKTISPFELEKRVKKTAFDMKLLDGFIQQDSTGIKLVVKDESDVIKAFTRKS